MGTIYRHVAHDHLVKKMLEHPLYRMEMLQLFLPEARFQWNRLRLESKIFSDSKTREKYADFVFSAPRQRGTTRIYLLIEHKSYQNGKELFKQLRNYVGHFIAKNRLVLTLVFYNGKRKNWNIPRTLQTHIGEACSDLPEIPDFGYILLNFHDYRDNAEAKKLKVWPLLSILTSVWNLNEGVVEEHFRLAQKTGRKNYIRVMNLMVAYIQRVAPLWTYEKLAAIETRVVDNEKERFMRVYKSTLEYCREMLLEEIREEVRAEGKVEGREEGREEGRKEGREETLTEMALNMFEKGFAAEHIRIALEDE